MNGNPTTESDPSHSKTDHLPEDLTNHAGTRLDRRWQALLTAVAIGSLPILALEFQSQDLVPADRRLIDIVNVVVLVVFAVDYFAGLWRAEHKRRYVREEWLELLLVVSQALVLVPSLAAFGILRALRATRVFRLVGAVVRLAAIGGIASHSGRALLRERAFPFALGIAGLTWITSAVAFTVVEDVGVDGRLESFGDGLWWSLATITTVGYGDVYPVTGAGRIVGGLTMVIGISVFAVVTARIAEFFLEPPSA